MKPKVIITLSLLACLLTSPAEAMGERKSDKPSRVTMAEDRACSADSDCVQVELSRSGCCDYDAVAKVHKALYDKAAKLTCEGYKGGVCECYDPDYKTRLRRPPMR